MSQRSIEIKVGILILVALGLLGSFIVVMGGLSLTPTFTVNVDFDNPGGLKEGAPVRLSGVKIGRITAIEFRGGKVDPKSDERPSLIRVVTSIDDTYRSSLFENSRWFVTTQGVLGELFLAVDPGTPDRPLLHDGSVVHGISPPRLDLLLSEAYELLHRAYTGVVDNEKQIKETFDGLHRTLRATGDLLERNESKLDKVVDNVETLTVEANETLLAAREKYVDGPQVGRIMNNVEGASATLNQNVGPLIEDSRRVMNDVSKLSNALASDDQLARYKQITRDLGDAATQARAMTRDAQTLVGHIKRGEGTVGALVMDEAVYDDLQELIRDLKHNPWKFFWRE
jgi:phospholipid/cholesterol/gamma-HCH transport system substrate-binding protein